MSDELFPGTWWRKWAKQNRRQFSWSAAGRKSPRKSVLNTLCLIRPLVQAIPWDAWWLLLVWCIRALMWQMIRMWIKNALGRRRAIYCRPWFGFSCSTLWLSQCFAQSSTNNYQPAPTIGNIFQPEWSKFNAISGEFLFVSCHWKEHEVSITFYHPTVSMKTEFVVNESKLR